MASEEVVEVVPPADQEENLDVAVAGKKEEKKAAAPVENAEGIEELKKQVEKARRESAERLAAKDKAIREAYERAQKAELQVAETQRDSVATTIDRLKSEKDTAKRDYQLAVEAGDAAKMADAQDRLSMANAQLVQAEKGKLALDEQVEDRKTQKPTSVPSNDWASQLEARGLPKSAAWIRSHPEYADNGGQLSKSLERAHYAALGDGHTVESDGYFQAINERLGLDGAQRPSSTPGRSAKTTSISAPVVRQAPVHSKNSMPSTIRLTPEEVATADALGMDRATYAKHLWEAAQEGKINRTFQ